MSMDQESTESTQVEEIDPDVPEMTTPAEETEQDSVPRQAFSLWFKLTLVAIALAAVAVVVTANSTISEINNSASLFPNPTLGI